MIPQHYRSNFFLWYQANPFIAREAFSISHFFLFLLSRVNTSRRHVAFSLHSFDFRTFSSLRVPNMFYASDVKKKNLSWNLSRYSARHASHL